MLTRPLHKNLSLCSLLLSAHLASSCAATGDEDLPTNESESLSVDELGSTSQALIDNVAFQPGPEGKDARVFSIVSQRNQANGGTTNKFLAMAWTWSGEKGNIRSFIDFEGLNTLPANAKIRKATLKLFAEMTQGVNQKGHSQLTGTNEILVRRVTSPWGENTVTWNNQPSTSLADQISLPKSTSNSQDYVIDVTNFVQQRVSDPSHNFGMSIQLKTEVNYRAVHFGSSDHANPAIRPRLEVEFEVPDVVCDVLPKQELMITDLSVVEDPVRTGPGGAWSFGKLMENMAPTPELAPAFVRQWVESWSIPQTVSSGKTIAPRPGITAMILDEWPKLPGSGELDLTRAPFRLLAIVNRPDLRNTAEGRGGEGRFVFGLTSGGFPQQFAVILEYRLPATSAAGVVDWAEHWHELRSLPFPSAAYNEKLEEVTQRFAGRNAEPGAPNGNAISQVRSNELTVEFPWELREWVLPAGGGFLQADTVKGTPSTSLSSSERVTLVNFLNANESAVLAGTHTLPASLIAGSSLNNLSDWTGLTGVNREDVRHAFAISTCNGCHGVEAESGFLQIQVRGQGQEASLSQFLEGPTFNDLGRRKADMESLLCAAQAPAVPGARLGEDGDAVAVPVAPAVDFEKGISRVH
jgi:hypothetical protein